MAALRTEEMRGAHCMEERRARTLRWGAVPFFLLAGGCGSMLLLVLLGGQGCGQGQRQDLNIGEIVQTKNNHMCEKLYEKGVYSTKINIFVVVKNRKNKKIKRNLISLKPLTFT
jgi:hypothetical protein